jgi:hypothetical protein
LDLTALLESEDGDEVATAVKLKSYLKDDPVHLSADGYADIVQGILDKIMGWGEFTRTPRSVSSSHANTGSGNKSRNWSKSRRDWVEKDDAIAHRSYNDYSRGRGRGRGGRAPRGGFRGGTRGGGFGGDRGGRFGSGRGGFKNKFERHKPY